MRRYRFVGCFCWSVWSAATSIAGFVRNSRSTGFGRHSSVGLQGSRRAVELVHLDHIDRVLCLSDLHTDHSDNMQWLANHTCPATVPESYDDDCTVVVGESDLVVVAGDISHDMDRIEQSLMYLLRTGASVVFVAGNHEAWLHSKELDKDPTRSSLDKIKEVYQTCRDLGVYTPETCIRVGGTPERPHCLWLASLDSWYDASLSLKGCEDLCRDFGKWPWVDFVKCQWQGYESMGAPNGKIPDGVSEYFAKENEPMLKRLQDWIEDLDEDTVGSCALMTISHFLPNQRCLPDWKNVDSPVFRRDRWLDHGGGGVSAKFAKVAGTQLLDEQIRGIELPDHVRRIHVFGHSHRPKDFEWQGIRYIHNPLGKPREREIYMISPAMDFQEVWNTKTKGEVPGEQIIRYWEEKGGGLEALVVRLNNSKRKSRYGKHLKRRMESSSRQKRKR